jgi:6-phosphogluconolactonase (cycloisomerase 2 family)
MTDRRPSRTLLVGTYPVAGQGTPAGRGEGVWRLRLDPVTGRLDDAEQLAATPAPSFLAIGSDPSLVYAVNEDVDGRLSAFRRTEAGLDQLAVAGTGGAHPCHLLLVPQLDAIVVANYTSGSLSVLRLRSDGLPERDEPDQLIELHGRGPRADRQESSHAHYLLSAPGGQHLLLVDLGADRVLRFRLDPATRTVIEDGSAVTLPAGSGPRHAVFSGDGTRLHIVGELDGRLHTVDWNASAAAGDVISSIPAQTRRGEAHLSHISRTGTTLQLGVRGHDLLAVHTLGSDGLPRLSAEQALPGSWPRHHAHVGPWTLVAQQNGGGIVALAPDGTVRGHADVPSPACVLPISEPDWEE